MYETDRSFGPSSWVETRPSSMAEENHTAGAFPIEPSCNTSSTRDRIAERPSARMQWRQFLIQLRVNIEALHPFTSLQQPSCLSQYGVGVSATFGLVGGLVGAIGGNLPGAIAVAAVYAVLGLGNVMVRDTDPSSISRWRHPQRFDWRQFASVVLLYSTALEVSLWVSITALIVFSLSAPNFSANTSTG